MNGSWATGSGLGRISVTMGVVMAASVAKVEPGRTRERARPGPMVSGS